VLIGDILRRQASPAGRPDKPAILFEGEATTFSALNARANRIANGLLRLGLRRGDRVALLGRNSPAWVAAYYAAAKCGAILVPVNFWYRAGELAYVLRDSGARFCLLNRAHAALAAEVRASTDTPTSVEHWIWLDGAPAANRVDSSSGTPAGIAAGGRADLSMEALCAGVSDDEPVLPGEALSETDPHIILYTSGTTGFPKGAVLSHRAHVLHAMTFALHTGAVPDDVYLNVYPLFHTGGTDCAVLPYHLVGATVALLPDPKPEAVLDAMERYRVTAMMAVPTVWRRLVESPDVRQRDLSAFRRAMGSSDAMPLDLLEQVLHTFGSAAPAASYETSASQTSASQVSASRAIASQAIAPEASSHVPGNRTSEVTWTQTYGLTEAGCILTYLPPADHTRKLGSAGKPHAQTDLVVADPSRSGEPGWPTRPGHQVPSGEVGEVVARTEHVMSHYWNKPQQTADSLVNGWLRSGDLGSLDAEGYLFIVGRLKDVIVSGGEKIYPAEVEPALRDFPGVAEIALFGVPDREWGESVGAAIVLESGTSVDEAEFKRWARARVAGFKTPKHVVFVDELPRTTGTGKVQKAALRAMLAHLGG
jgi:fatty-acyl-CoA synthase